MIPLLAPLFPEPFTHYGESLQCAPDWPVDALPVAALLVDPARLDAFLARYYQRRGVDPTDRPARRAAVSAWTLDYVAALLPPLAAAASVLQHVLPAAAADLALQLDEHGAPRRFHLRHADVRQLGRPAPGESTAQRYDALLWQHLDPLFQALATHTGLARKVLWGNAARWMAATLDQALAASGGAPPVAADRAWLLDEAHWPGDRANPLYPRLATPMRSASIGAETLHRQCCLYYLLPGEDYCAACPLTCPAPERGRGRPVPVSVQGSPATTSAIPPAVTPAVSLATGPATGPAIKRAPPPPPAPSSPAHRASPETGCG